MIANDNEDDNKENLLKIRKNIKCVIDGSNKGNSYFDYETDTFIFFVEKYSDIVYEYSEEIFLVYVKFFENLYNMCSKKKNYIDDNSFSYYVKNLKEKIIPDNKINDLFKILFKNPKNIINKDNIKYFAFSNSGQSIINCYIESKIKQNKKFCFSEVETMIFMNCISENPIWDLSESLIKIINNNDTFSYNDNLLIYASYIPLNNYIKRYIDKNRKKKNIFTERTKQNILMYSNELDLCNEIIDSLTNEYLEFACKSKNIKIIKNVLDTKIVPNNNIFEKVLKFNYNENERFDENNSSKFKIFDVNNENEIFLYSEVDQYFSKKDKHPLLIRKIKRSDFCSNQNLIQLLEKYGISYTKNDYLLSINYKILLTPINLDMNITDDKFREEFLNVCSENSYYPYFDNNKYPKPDKICLYRECNKKNNLKMIKQLTDNVIEPDIECLRIVSSLNYNNLNTIKFFIEKKNIKPDFLCIKNNLRNIINNDNLLNNMNENNINKFIESYGNTITKYLYGKYISIKK
jgi:hypothetical protein